MKRRERGVVKNDGADHEAPDQSAPAANQPARHGQQDARHPMQTVHEVQFAVAEPIADDPNITLFGFLGHDPARLALLVVGLLCWPRTSGRFTREQYDRIRLGMTPAEVSAVMGCKPAATALSQNEWENVATELEAGPGPGGPCLVECWVDGDILIDVLYQGERARMKQIGKHATWAWKLRNGNQLLSTACSGSQWSAEIRPHFTVQVAMADPLRSRPNSFTRRETQKASSPLFDRRKRKKLPLLIDACLLISHRSKDRRPLRYQTPVWARALCSGADEHASAE
jgi:hypothetical protein